MLINAPAAPEDPTRRPTGFSATELLLAGAGACASWDVVEMLRKRRLALSGVEVTVEGIQADAPPWQYERLALHFTIHSDGLSEGVLERVIRLAVVRYCSVVSTLRGVAKVEATLELVDSRGTNSGRRPVRLDVFVAEPLDEPSALAPATDED